MLKNAEEINITTHFGEDDVGVYMTPGVRVAKEEEDEEEEPENVDFYHFEKTVTEALAYVTKLEVLHFPNSVSRKMLKKRYMRMMMEDVKTCKAYECWVRTARRKNYEKCLGGGWFDFVVDRGLKVNDKLLFELEDPPNKMYVRHIRHQ
ncbi:B3 DNA-binding domain protein [Medicago truncatula]|uniref:B3 DNA-binding domain protein n=1 Tax=Medicago truncatula TaxID=3880 RepID=A0A072U688_MEDTR|nr:B3 DNA-binding domain protein [Medicago truncatula]